MRNYLTLRNPTTIVIGIFVVLFLGGVFGIRFENIYLNKTIGLLLYAFSIYLFVVTLKDEFKNKILKMVLLVLVGLFALGSLILIFFNAIDLYSTSQNAGVDPAFEKVRVLNVGSSRVAVYRTDAGAMTAFGVVARTEKNILPGIYIKRDLLNIDGADDVNLSIATPDSIKIDSISFTSPEYRSEYINNNTKATEGQVIKVKALDSTIYVTIFLILAGIATFIYGVLNVLGRTKNDISKDSEMDKKLISKETRYFMGRYYAGIQFMAAGLGAILLGLIFLK